jgi:hypothetical protein
MCFSATASFVTAGAMVAAGAVTLRRVERREDLLLAAVPLFLAVQQATEGMLWLALPVMPDQPVSTWLTLTFLLFAKLFWPIFAPLAVLLAEPEPWRRRAMAACLAFGVAVALFFLWSFTVDSHASQIVGRHIVYSQTRGTPAIVGLAYLLATGITPALSSHRFLKRFAAIVIVGSLVSFLFYWEAFVSVWCFFATAVSAVLVLHFDRARATRRSA